MLRYYITMLYEMKQIIVCRRPLNIYNRLSLGLCVSFMMRVNFQSKFNLISVKLLHFTRETWSRIYFTLLFEVVAFLLNFDSMDQILVRSNTGNS